MRAVGIAVASVLFAHPALAIDCTAASSAAEKAICSDPDARSADAALGKAYGQLRNSLSADASSGLRRSQTEWIRSRDAVCAAPNAIKPLSECIAVQSRARQAFLDGRPRAGDVSDRLFRRVFISRPAKNGSVDLSISAIEFVGNGDWQSRLNVLLDSAVKRAISDAEAGKENPGPHDNYEVSLEIDVPYASSRLVSVHVTGGSYLGQAHPDSGSYNINFDRTLNRQLRFDDLLDEAGAKPIFEFCRSEVAKQKKQRSDDPGHWKDDVELTEVSENSKDLKSWSFDATAAVIDYGTYGFGGYGQCMCSCTIPYSMLRPMVKKDFPLP
ncbi:lysozyme inhibitor LprI family protein [Bradyrhizobium brasilense]|uniref:lysozyme inhibitor LprI family protein n=1 Tax=Bradyrhizobium brasilense TaxID=1419277 RepID=UPI0024B1A094|nr:lysozyme inhibitor LprI family protein [Bradyrhizobium australafricanum]WFU33237.1 lysozyme inhibitor LprI family protein [Bradyrhizobium australafricanum]